MVKRRIYLDHAATSWPKLPEALSAAAKFVEQCGATSGRGNYTSAVEAEKWINDARRNLAKLINSSHTNCIAFCNSGTHALNAALYGLLRAGDHVVTTAIEHNSVLRPLRQFEKSRGVKLSIAGCDSNGLVHIDEFKKLIQPKTRFIVAGHASNVTGQLQPISELSKLAREVGAKLIVDASQTLGYVPIDVQVGIDVLAAAGHKGLRAAAGTAMLFVASDLQNELQPLMFGGTGTASENIDDVPKWPQSVEVGNLNLPGIVSLSVAAGVAIDHLEKAALKPLNELVLRMVAHLQSIGGVRLIGDFHTADRLPVISLLAEGWDIHDLANVLDASFGIETRAGLHCAALIHDFIGSRESGGTLRLSLGSSTTVAELDEACDAFSRVLES